MQTPFYQRPAFLIVVAIGSLITLAKHLAGGVAWLYALALTPQGAAAILVACMLCSAASVLVAVLRR